MTKLVVRDPFLRGAFSFPTLIPQNVFQDLNRTLAEALEIDVNRPNVSLTKGFPKGGVSLDKDGNAVIQLALAGYSKDSLSISVEDNRLVISAEKQEGDEDGALFARRAFTKEFPNFTHEWDLKAAEATYKDGLLRVVVPRVAQEADVVTNIEIK